MVASQGAGFGAASEKFAEYLLHSLYYAQGVERAEFGLRGYLMGDHEEH